MKKQATEYILSDNEQQQGNKGSQSQQDNQQQKPEFTQIDGKVIKLGGLDYNLLKQHREQEDKEKRSFLNSLNLKIGNIIADVARRSQNGDIVDTVGNADKVVRESGGYLKQNDEYNKYKGLIKAIKQRKIIETKTDFESMADSDTNWKKSEQYLHFNLNQLDLRIPTRIQKRIGRCSNHQIFVHFDDRFIQQFANAVHSANKANNHQDTRLAGDFMVEEDSEDDIFASENSDQPKLDTKLERKVNIQIGKKLNFNLEQDIFTNIKRPKPIGDLDLDTLQPTQIKKQDKYSFMPKQSKPSLNSGKQDEGYDECYYQSGPSLQQLVDLKKQGIEFYGDLKQFKAKQRKVNINKEYSMVQKIIESKKKQGK